MVQLPALRIFIPKQGRTDNSASWKTLPDTKLFIISIYIHQCSVLSLGLDGKSEPPSIFTILRAKKYALQIYQGVPSMKGKLEFILEMSIL